MGSFTEPPMLSLTSRVVRSSRDVSGVGQRPREPIELRDDQRVATAARRQRLAQPRTIAIGPGQAVIDVGARDRYAERRQRIALRGEVLILC